MIESLQGAVLASIRATHPNAVVHWITGPFDGLDWQLQVRSGDMACYVQFRHGWDDPERNLLRRMRDVQSFVCHDFSEGGKSTSMFKPKEAKELWPGPDLDKDGQS